MRCCGISRLPACCWRCRTNKSSAQQPTQAQRDAIRAACRSDFMANCSGVQPGGKEAFECLVRNDAKLSAPCKSAVNAAAPKPAEPAAAPRRAAAPARSETAPPAAKVERAPPGIEVAPAEAQNEQLKAVQQACTLNDFVSHCSWIAPNNPEILQCLKANTADLSPNCRAAVQSLPAAPPPAAAAPAEPVKQAAPAKKPVEPKPAEPARASAPPPPACAAPAAAAPAKPTAQQTAAIRAACRSDFMSRCSGVQPGGAEALQCLKRNETQLSAACRSAVAAVGGGAPRRRHHPEHRRQRLRLRSRHRTDADAAPARGARRSCKFAVSKCGRSVPVFRSAAAVSSVASPQTHRACRRAVTGAERGGGPVTRPLPGPPYRPAASSRMTL